MPTKKLDPWHVLVILILHWSTLGSHVCITFSVVPPTSNISKSYLIRRYWFLRDSILMATYFPPHPVRNIKSKEV